MKKSSERYKHLSANQKEVKVAEICGAFLRQKQQQVLSGEGGGSQRTLGSSLDDGWMIAPSAKDPRRVLNSVLHSTPVGWGEGKRGRHGVGRESAPWELSVRRRTRKPVLYCKCSDQQEHRHLGPRVHSGQEGRKARKERCQAHLGLEVSLKSQEDHLAGEGKGAEAWQQEWLSKEGEADAQFTNLCCEVTGSHRSM